MTETAAASAVPADNSASADARSAYGYGVATISTRNGEATVLDVWFPRRPSEPQRTPAGRGKRGSGASRDRRSRHRRGPRHRAAGGFRPDRPRRAPADTADAYLRLHLLSHRLVQPNTLNLDGIFGVLTNVVWTNLGPCAVDGFELTRRRAAPPAAPCTCHGVDKFPRMVDYVVPRASASPTPTASASARTSPRAPP